MYFKGDIIVLNNGEVGEILECRGYGYSTDVLVYYVNFENGICLVEETEINRVL